MTEPVVPFRERLRVAGLLPDPPPPNGAVSPPLRVAESGTAYADAALAAEVERVASAAEGTRNDTLNRAAFAVGQLVAGGALDGEAAAAALAGAAGTAGLPEREVSVTIRSGFTAAASSPRTVPEPPALTSFTVPAGSGPQPDAGRSSRPFTVVNLAEHAGRGVLPPDLICGGYLYRPGTHTLSGPPDAGKTVVTTAWAAGLLHAGESVVGFDEESGAEQTAEKLLSFGVEAAELARLHYVEYPNRRWDAADVAAVAELLTAVRPALVYFDSSAAFLARAGLDEDRAPDVTRFWSEVLLPCARTYGAAVVVIDHVPKAATGGRYARGSGAKLASTDVAYMLDAIRPFSRAEDGLLKLTVSKDRRGYLDRRHEVRVSVTDGLALTFTTVDGSYDPTLAGLPPAAVKLLEVLRAESEPATMTALIDGMAAKFGHGLKRNTASEALNSLADRGLADSAETGPRGEKSWWSA